MDHSAKTPSRRSVLASSLGAVSLASLGAGAARAAGEFAGKTVVFASWGGSYQDAEKQSYCDPFAAETGARVVQDGPMNAAKFRAMIEGGSPDWDVADVTIEFLYAGLADGMFEKIDHKAVDVSRIDPKFVHDYGIGCIAWSYNLGFSTKTYTGKEPPKTWADLYDLKKYPGKRMVADNPVATLETALMADGVSPDKLYPLDVDRALRKLSAIKSDLILSSSNSQSQQLFVDGEINLGIILNGRAYDAAKKGAPIAISWEQNIQSVDYLVIPRGSRNVAAAQKLLDTMTVAANQAKLANMIAYAPTNPAAFAAIDPKISPWLSTEPENNRKGFVINAEYWRDNLKSNQERWTAWKLSWAVRASSAGRMARRSFPSVDRRAWLLVPALAVLAVVFLWPVGWLLSRAFTEPRPGFGNFVQLIERPGYVQVLWNTLVIAATVTPICVAIGFPVAHAMTYGGPRLRRWLVFVVLVPFWTSLLVRSFATVILLQRNGPVNGLLQWLGLTSEPVPLIYNLTGVLAGAIQVLLPFVIFPLHAAMLRIDPTLLPAALTLGASPVRAFWRVYLPLTIPGLVTGATLVFISMLGYYVTPAMLGSPRQTMIAQVIQDQIAQFGNWGIAGALSLTLIAVSGVLLVLVQTTVGLKAVAR